MRYGNQYGYTLVELMIVVAVLTVLAGISIPLYRNYIIEARLNAVRQNVEPLRVAMEDYFLDNMAYVGGTWDPSGTQTLESGALGWRPDGDADKFVYTVTTVANGYTLVVSDTSSSASTTCTRNIATGSFTCN